MTGFRMLKSSKNKNILYWGILVIYVFGILLSTTVFSLNFVPHKYKVLRNIVSYTAHFVFFGVFYFYTLLGLNLKSGKIMDWKKSSYWAAFFPAIFFGVFIEYLQSFVPTRMASLYDVAADMFGIVFVLVTLKYCKFVRESMAQL